MDGMTLTEADINQIEKILDSKFPKLMEKIDKILEILSDFAGRLKDVEDEQAIHNKQASEYGKRLESLEKIHPAGQHSS